MKTPMIVEAARTPIGRARLVGSMVHELRRQGARLGCASMCAGGGMGMAMVVEAH